MNYLYFALLTVICWGTYGICMHTGSMNMKNPENGRLMAFLWVGLAYFLTAFSTERLPLSFFATESTADASTRYSLNEII